MRVWTILDEKGMSSLEGKGVLRCDAQRVDRDRKRAYAWIAGKLSEKAGPAPKGVRFPMWTWAAWDAGRGRTRPDLRSSCHLPRGTKGFRLELEVDPGRVLQSDFEAWHAVLNGWFLGKDEAEDEGFDAEMKAAGVRWGWPYPEPFASKVVASWDRIFELGPPAPTHFHRDPPDVQGVLWEIRRADAVKVDSFVGR